MQILLEIFCEVVIYLKVTFQKYMNDPDDNLPLEGLLGTTGLYLTMVHIVQFSFNKSHTCLR